ncbi:MAG: ABC transporter permease subunit [Lachnospiraceae bacterium]|nr:ABC transporter permease subunit [Lachnospiraceae bacterium]
MLLSLKKRLKKTDWLLLLLLAPGIIWLVMFAYVPIAGIRMAFYNYNVFKGFTGSTFVGLQNFKTLFQGADFPRALRNTLIIGGLQLLFCFPFPIFLAIVINQVRIKFLGKLTQTLTFIPYFISTVVACGMVVSFCSPSTGIINLIRNFFGLDSIYFLVQAKYFRAIYIILNLWKNSGYNAVVYIAALAGIDEGLYEAASLDGASRLKQIWYVTLPGLMNTIVVMLILNVGGIIKVGYETIILLYQPSTYETADVISTLTYRLGIVQNNFGISTAAGLFESLVALVLVLLTNYASKKFTESSMF